MKAALASRIKPLLIRLLGEHKAVRVGFVSPADMLIAFNGAEHNLS